MPQPWNGSERRKENTDHDTLIQIVQIMDNHVKNFQTHAEAFRAHEVQDQTNFDKLRTQIAKIERIIYIATGVLLAVQALPTVFKIIHIFDK